MPPGICCDDTNIEIEIDHTTTMASTSDELGGPGRASSRTWNTHSLGDIIDPGPELLNQQNQLAGDSNQEAEGVSDDSDGQSTDVMQQHGQLAHRQSIPEATGRIPHPTPFLLNSGTPSTHLTPRAALGVATGAATSAPTSAASVEARGTLRYPIPAFEPMAALSEAVRAMRLNPTPQEVVRRVRHGVSPNYQGDYTLRSNQPADIPDDENCALWATGLPPDLTHHELLACIRDVDRMWQTVINPAQSGHQTSAAKITFFTPEGARALLDRCRGTGFVVRNYCGTLAYNRNKVPRPNAPRENTRVVVINGPKEIVNVDYLREYFGRRFFFDIDEVEPWVAGKVINILEWRFGSYRCQAQAA